MKRIANRIDMSNLRQMCIDHKYYSCGDCKAYDSMLTRYKDDKDVSAEEIYDLAKDIKEHSDTEATVDTIAFNILKEATYNLFL